MAMLSAINPAPRARTRGLQLLSAMSARRIASDRSEAAARQVTVHPESVGIDQRLASTLANHALLAGTTASTGSFSARMCHSERRIGGRGVRTRYPGGGRQWRRRKPGYETCLVFSNRHAPAVESDHADQ